MYMDTDAGKKRAPNKKSLPRREDRSESGDILRAEGIYRCGYGIVPKFVMHDPDLSLESKAIYAYLCALAGGGERTFPFRNTILRQINLSKNTYYRHYGPLLEQGYLTVQRSPERDGGNLYTLVGSPKKLEKVPSGSMAKGEGRLRYVGLKAGGYGTLPRAVMTDERLSVKAKGLYAYFCSYCGAGDHAFPCREHILYHLNISEPTYYKALGQLRELDYLRIVQRKENGKFAVNDYFLNEFPGQTPPDDPSPRDWDVNCPETDATPSLTREDMVPAPCPRSWDIGFSPCPRNGDTKNGDVKNGDVYINNNHSSNKPVKDRSGALGRLVSACLGRRAPGEAEGLLREFLPCFEENIRNREIRNLPAYVETSVAAFLQKRRDGPPVWGGGAGRTRRCSYDLGELEAMIEDGDGLRPHAVNLAGKTVGAGGAEATGGW